jgi:hypothetical protein
LSEDSLLAASQAASSAEDVAPFVGTAAAMDREKLAKLASAVRTGGKGTMRR